MKTLTLAVLVVLVSTTLTGCGGCYDTYAKAHEACTDKHGTCRYLGKQFEVCPVEHYDEEDIRRNTWVGNN